jgi:hypothetical protein
VESLGEVMEIIGKWGLLGFGLWEKEGREEKENL